MMDSSVSEALADCESIRDGLDLTLADLQRAVSNEDMYEFDSLLEEAGDGLLALMESCESLQPVLEKSRWSLRLEPEFLGRELRHVRHDLQTTALYTDNPDELRHAMKDWERSFDGWDRRFRDLLKRARAGDS